MLLMIDARPVLRHSARQYARRFTSPSLALGAIQVFNMIAAVPCLLSRLDSAGVMKAATKAAIHAGSLPADLGIGKRRSRRRGLRGKAFSIFQMSAVKR